MVLKPPGFSVVLSELVLLLAGSYDHALAHGKDGANGKDPQRYLDSMRNAKALKPKISRSGRSMRPPTILNPDASPLALI